MQLIVKDPMHPLHMVYTNMHMSYMIGTLIWKMRNISDPSNVEIMMNWVS